MKPLNTLQKRDLLASKKTDPETLRAYGEEYFSQERYSEAFEFFRRIEDAQAIGRLKEKAVELADADLLWRIEHAIDHTVTREDWTACAASAMRMEKYRPAAFIYRRLGENDKAAEAEAHFTAAPAHPPVPEAHQPK